MGRTRDELLETIGADELQERMAMASFVPFDADRIEYMLAKVCAVVVACARGLGGGKGRDPQPEDYLPKYGPPKKSSPADMWATLMAGTKKLETMGFNGRNDRKT